MLPAEDNNDVQYLIAYPENDILDKSSWTMKDFGESGDPLCQNKTEALEAMVDLDFDDDEDEYKHGLIVRVKKKKSADDDVFQFTQNVPHFTDKYIVLDAELFEISNKKYFSTHSYRFTEQGIRSLMNADDPLRSRIERVLSLSSSVTNLNDRDKNVAWEKVKDETYQLLADLLDHRKTHRYTLEQKKAELDIMLKGLILTKDVLQNPTDAKVNQLKTFVEKEAPGKTNHWMRWGGALLAVVALAAFILSIVVTAGGSAAATGVIFPAVLASGAGVGASFFGQQQGLAKATSTIVEQAESDLKPKGPGSQG